MIQTQKLGIDTAIAEPIRRALDPAHIVGQGYDGAGKVSGKVCGVHACITHHTVSRSSLCSLQKPRSQLGDRELSGILVTVWTRSKK